MPECSVINYDTDLVTHGYINLTRLRIENDQLSLEKIYEKFHREFKYNLGSQDFCSMFEKIQIKSFSEAIAETVGSIMNRAFSSGRNLEPINLSKEICLVYNLPSLHLLKHTLIPELTDDICKKKQFLRTCGMTFPSYQAKLKFPNWSSSVGNFRVKEEEKCKLPVSFFKPVVLRPRLPG